jgi:uncharacterized protein (TIGR03435 family)
MLRGLREISTEKLGGAFRTRRKRLLMAAGLIAIAVSGLVVLASAQQSRAQTQNQNTTAAGSNFEYEAVTIKPSKGPGPDAKIGMWPAPDGFTAWFVTPQQMISTAYGYGTQRFRISGGPAWLSTERFDIEAKMDAATADALAKLNPGQRVLAQQKMLQTLLADRFKLTVHREARELLIYDLVVAKSGAKLQAAKPGDTYADGIKNPDGSLGGPGDMSGGVFDGWITAQAVTIANLAGELTQMLGHPVTDKTGLMGAYDFKLRFTPDDRLQAPGGAAPIERPALPSSDSDEPSLFAAIQEQLGLKLEAGKGPVEIIVIDHVERPSGN